MAALEEAFRKGSSKFKIFELNHYQKLAIRNVFVEKEDVFVEGVDRPNTTHKLVITVFCSNEDISQRFCSFI